MAEIKPPSGLSQRGRRLWRAVVGAFELDEHEVALLREACRTADQLDALNAAVRADGVTLTTPQGVKAHPALVEARQQRLVLVRLLAALGLPAGMEDEQATTTPTLRAITGPHRGASA